MFAEQVEWVILGETEIGEIFDVPSWPERLCGMLADRGRIIERVILTICVQLTSTTSPQCWWKVVWHRTTPHPSPS